MTKIKRIKQRTQMDFTPGTIYRYAPWFKDKSGGSNPVRVACGRYKILGVAWDGGTKQLRIVYEGLDGNDAGEWFTCSVGDFAAKFVPVEPEPKEVGTGSASAEQPYVAPVPAIRSGLADMTTRGPGR